MPLSRRIGPGYDAPMPRVIHRRWTLVLLVALAQSLVLLAASVWLVRWLDVSVEEVVRDPDLPRAADVRQAAIDRIGHDVRTIVFTLSAVVVGFSAALTAAVVWRYENRMAGINRGLEAQVRTRSLALVNSRHAVILGLAKLAESRDDQTGRHLDRIRAYVVILAKRMMRVNAELTPAFIENLAETSSLHDIGKVGVPDSVLLHPGRLSDEQRAVINKHPLIGGDTLLAIKKVWGENDPFLVTACEIAFGHHERWDGKGYPFGLAADQIPLAARIVAVADVYDALTTKRVYKDAMSHDEARAIIVSGSGSHFDPDVVQAFIAGEDEFRAVLREQGRA